MGIYVEESIADKYGTNREILEQMYRHALEKRPPAKVSYRPCTLQPHIDMTNRPGVDFAAYYPDYKPGDYAYYTCNLEGMFERELVINVRGNCPVELYFNGERQELLPAPRGTLDAKVVFQKGKNTLLLKATAGADGFAAYTVPIVPGLRLSAIDHGYATWQYREKAGFRLQEGIELSRLYDEAEAVPVPERKAIAWVYPLSPIQSNSKSFDFSQQFQKGKAAYVYTCVKGRISIRHTAPIKIFSGNKVLYQGTAGQHVDTFEKETELLVKSCRGTDAWGFQAETDGEHSLPFVESADCPDLQWLWIGPFGRDTDTEEEIYAPEVQLKFSEPYASVSGGLVYWQFYRPDTLLKLYLQSTFFGQWSYAMMVGHYGMKQAARKLGETDFQKYFMESMRLLCRHRNYAVLDGERTGWSSYLPQSKQLERLDPIGTIGINIAEYYMMSGDDKAQYLLELLGKSITYHVPRFEDGTFYRIQTMWTDDMYMSLPFLVRLGVMTGEERYFDDILTQVRGFVKRLFMEEQGLFSHIYFVEEGKPNRVPWGRGNGWVLLALSEVLLLMPETYHGREEILEVYRKFAEGVLAHRDPEYGFWHQVINNPNSYMEASGSAMFITALARGVQEGWLDESLTETIVDAWKALICHCVDAEGNVHGVCMGSSCSMDEKYYIQLGTITNDDHGVGILLGAGVEVMNMLEKYSIN